MNKYHLTNRPNREITEKGKIHSIIRNGKFITVAMCRNAEPYIVTLSYGYDKVNQTLYFHSSTKGLKLDFLNANKNVCATIIEDGGYVKNECAHEYTSVVLFGTMEVVYDLEEKKRGMQVLLNHLEENADVRKKMILKSEEAYKNMAILKLCITNFKAKKGR